MAGFAAVLAVDGGGLAPSPALVDARVSPIAAPATARVLAVKVREGDAVSAGQVVVELDPEDAQSDVALAEAELERVRLEVRAREIGAEDQDFELGVRLEAELDKARLAIASLDAAIQRDQAELSELEARVAREQELVAQRLQSGSALEDLRERRSALARAVELARSERAAAARVAATSAGRLDAWRARHQDDQALTAPDEAAARAQEERVRRARRDRERLVVVAPFAGTVQRVDVQPGGVAVAGAPLLAVLLAPTSATAWLPEDAAWAVKPGDPVILRSTDGEGLAVQGSVRALGGGILEAPPRLWQLPGEPWFGRAVYVDLAPAGPLPLPGQTLEARFPGR